MARLIIVCGPPASGKTTLARLLSNRLGLPVISKDSLKEALMDRLGGSPAVGAAAYAVQFDMAHELLRSGVGLILEGAFFDGQAALAELAAGSETAVLQLDCPVELLERRYIERQPDRHPGHRGLEALPDLRERVRSGAYRVADLGVPTLAIDSSDGFDPAETEIMSWLHQHTQTPVDKIRTVRGERLDLRAAWDEQAEAWTRWARAPAHDSYWRFGREAFFSLLPAPGRRTVDVGCGEGRVSRDLARLGHRIVAIDGSKAMVAAAIQAAPDLAAIVADAAAIPLAGESCDLAIAYMSLQDVDDMQSAITEIARVLQPGGLLCMSVVHPINSAGQFESLEPDAPFIIDGSYLEPNHYVDDIERAGLRMRFSSLHHPLEDYFKPLESAGFLVEALREIPVGEWTSSDEPRHERWRRVPMFLHIRAVKH